MLQYLSDSETFSSYKQSPPFDFAESSGSERRIPDTERYGAYIEFCNHPQLKEIQKRVMRLAELRDNWNGSGGIPATQENVQAALKWIRDMWIDAMNVSKEMYRAPIWLNPHVSISEDGEIVFEWEFNQKQLHVYVTTADAVYISDSGDQPLDEMGDGHVNTDEERRAIWRFLLSI